jgi:hypothetical protein
VTAEGARRRAIIRTISAGSGLVGLAMVVEPARVTRLVSANRSEPPTWVVRLLGGRLVAQHALVLARPAHGTVLAGAVVDVLHAASMVAVAAVGRRYRRPAAVSAAAAAVSAAVGMATAPRGASR